MSSILPGKYSIENQAQSNIENFMSNFQIGKKLWNSNFKKEKGYSCIQIFKILFMLIFIGKNLFQFLESKGSEGSPEKDSFYRFLNSSRYNWRKFLLMLSSQVIKDTVSILTSDERAKVLIIDDSVYSRSRSKTVELLANVRDHARRRYQNGFRMLTLGWSDGNTFLPLAFSLLSSKDKKNRINEINPDIDKRTNGYKLRKESVKKSTDTMFDLLDQVIPYGIPAQYLLFDSWFSFPNVILKAVERNLHVICMLKSMPKVFYQYMDKSMNLPKLYNYIYKKPGRAKVLASVIVELGKDKNGQPVNVKIVFVRDRKNSRKWLALLSTDTNLSEEEVIRIYGKRWDIEVFFKMTKSYLQLAKEFQGRSYDMMVAHTTIVFCRYIMLSLETRSNIDSKSFGNLFYMCCDEVKDINFAQALFLLMDLLKNNLMDFLHLSEQKINEFLDHFIASLPVYFKDRLKILTCES